jgi:hypothetical protein
MVLPDNGRFGAIAVLGRKRRKDFAPNRYAAETSAGGEGSYEGA